MFCRYQKIFVMTLSILLLLCCYCQNSGEKNEAEPISSIEGKKVAIVVGQRYFKDEELNTPRTLFEKEGAVVKIVSSRLFEAEGDGGTKVKPDILIDSLNVAEFDAIVFIGGFGC